MGLLGDSFDDPKTQANLMLAAGLLGGGGFGQAMGRGLQGYQSVLSADAERQANKAYREAQIEQLKSQAAENRLKVEQQQSMQGLLGSIFGPKPTAQASAGDAYMPGMPSAGEMQPGGLKTSSLDEIARLRASGGPDLVSAWEKAQTGLQLEAGKYYLNPQTGKVQYMADPTKGVGIVDGVVAPLAGAAQSLASIEGAKAFETERAKAQFDPLKVYNSETQQDEYKPRSQVVGQNAVPQVQGWAGLTNAQKAMIQADMAKNPNPNPTIASNWDYGNKQGQAFAAGPSSSEALAQKGRESLRTEADRGFAGELTSSFKAANAALGTINTAQTLQSIFDSGKILAGPATKPEMLLTQIGEKLGVGGKDASEKLANTRIAMQEMAKSEMAAAQQMAGQGSITENERSLIARASSGDLSMSLPELKALSQALEKTGRSRIDSHQELVKRVTADPQFADYGARYSVNAPQPKASKVISWSEMK